MGRLLPDAVQEVIEALEHPSLDACSKAQLSEALKYIVDRDSFNRSIQKRLAAGQLYWEVLNFVFENLQDRISYDRIGVALLENEGNDLRMVWVKSNRPTQALRKGFSAPMKGSSLEAILKSGTPRIIPDLAAYTAAKPESESSRLALADGIRSSLTCPLIIGTKPIGFVFFSSFSPNTYAGSHVATFQEIAESIAVIVEYGRMREFLAANRREEAVMRKVVHDLRTPLCVIQGVLEQAFEESWYARSTANERELLAIVYENSKSMLELIADLANARSIEEEGYCPKSVDLRALLSSIRLNAEALCARKDIHLVMSFSPELPTTVHLDPLRVRQVMDNLLSNAVKFSARGSLITFQASVENDSVVLSVADQGQGIPENEIPKLFKRFSKTSVQPTEGEPGTGLGLSIVRDIADRAKGSISVETKQGVGSVFRFRVPYKA